MHDRIGEKLRKLAKVIFYVEAIGAVISEEEFQAILKKELRGILWNRQIWANCPLCG